VVGVVRIVPPPPPRGEGGGVNTDSLPTDKILSFLNLLGLALDPEGLGVSDSVWLTGVRGESVSSTSILRHSDTMSASEPGPSVSLLSIGSVESSGLTDSAKVSTSPSNF